MEGYREATTLGTSSYFQYGLTTNTYDKNGFLTKVTDLRAPTNNRELTNNASGQILAKLQNGLLQRSALFSGQQLAIYGDGMNAPLLSPTYAPASSAAGGGGIYTPVNPFPGNRAFTRQWNKANNNGAPIETASRTPVGGSGVRSYAVLAGDTLRSIAQSMYGSASMWWKIADANGLLGDAGLQVGQMLSIPMQAAGSANGAGDFRVYDASEIVGETSPNMPAPPPKKSGCGFLGKLIMIIVAVVVTAFTAGVGLGATGGGFWATVQAGGAALASGGVGIGAAITAGVAGNVVSQLVGMAIGAQDGFSWTSVALAGVSAGVGVGVNQFATGALSGAGTFATIGRAMIGSAISQGIGVVTGLQDKFSWAGVAASGVGAGVGSLVSEALGITDGQGNKTQSFRDAGSGEQFAKSLGVSFAARTATALARGGRVNITQVAADAFGNALGGYFANEIKVSQQEEQLRQAELAQIKREAAGQSSQALWATPLNVLGSYGGSGDGGGGNGGGGSGYGAGSAPSYAPGQLGSGTFGIAPSDGPITPGVSLLPMAAPTDAGSAQMRSTIADKGDSWARIARREYGDERYALALARANGASSTTLPLGSEVILPDLAGVNLKQGGAFIAADSLMRSNAAARANQPNYGNEGRNYPVTADTPLSAGWNMRDASAVILEREQFLNRIGAPQITQWDGISRPSAIEMAAARVDSARSNLGGAVGIVGGTVIANALGLDQGFVDGAAAVGAVTGDLLGARAGMRIGGSSKSLAGETQATSICKSYHAIRAAERRATDDFDLVNQPLVDKNGQSILVTKRIDLNTGQPIFESKLQISRPDAVNFERGLIVDDKPLGRPVSKDQQEIIRFIRAYEISQGTTPRTIAIERYSPTTGKPVVTELYRPSDFPLPRK